MVFHKVVKNKAYFKRYQVKFRRRREGKTDYYARKRLIAQDKNKYMTPKYRFVVRFTNRYVICQVMYSEVIGDKVIASAYSKELSNFGLKTGLKNYSAAYCTGLLCARRLLTSKGMAEMYEGNTDVNGQIVSTVGDSGKTYFVEEVDEETRPFRAVLDVGVRATTRGSRIWGALKGATDGGLDIPHNPKRFPGYDAEAKRYDASAHRERIFGGHVGAYMDHMEEEDEAGFHAHFRNYDSNGVSAEGLEAMYAAVHEAIRANPARAERRARYKDASHQGPAKRNRKQRANRVKQKKMARAQALARAMEAEDSD